MRKIIDNKLYDTEKADLVYSVPHYDIEECDFLCEDALYVTKKGSWFLVEEFASMDEPGTVSVSKDMSPKTVKEVYSWLLKHQAIDAIQQYFPDDIEEA